MWGAGFKHPSFIPTTIKRNYCGYCIVVNVVVVVVFGWLVCWLHADVAFLVVVYTKM